MESNNSNSKKLEMDEINSIKTVITKSTSTPDRLLVQSPTTPTSGESSKMFQSKTTHVWYNEYKSQTIHKSPKFSDNLRNQSEIDIHIMQIKGIPLHYY